MSGTVCSAVTSTPSPAAPCLRSSSSVAARRQPRLVGDLGRDRDRFGGARRVRVGDQRRGLHSSPSTAARQRPRDPRPRAPRRRTRRRSRGSPSVPAGRRRRSRGPAARAPEPRGRPTRIASRRSAGSRTTPRPTRSLPSSNCGLTIARTRPRARGSGPTAGRTLVSEMKETSTVASEGTKGRSAGCQSPRVAAARSRAPAGPPACARRAGRRRRRPRRPGRRRAAAGSR